MVENNQEIQKLNKNVESIMKHLGAQGSPAQAKKEADQKSKTAQQEADNASQGANLLDDKEKGEKESRKLFAGTMASGAFIWQNLSTHIFSKMNDIFGAVVGHVKEVLGPVVAVYDAAKATLLSAFDFVKGTIMSFKDKTTPAEKKTHGFLTRIALWADEQRKQVKAAFLGTISEKKPKKTGMFAMAMMVIGAIIGGIVSAILKPFALLGKAIKGIASMIMKIPKFSKAFNKLSRWIRILKVIVKRMPRRKGILGVIGRIFRFFGRIGKIFSWIVSKIPGVMGLLKGLKFGFKVLGWPIAVLFGIIDFIRGFIKEYGTSGSIIDSIGAGLKSAIIGFIELPVKLIGWMIDKVLGWLDIEGADSAKKILGFISDAFDFVFGGIKWYWKTSMKIFEMVFGELWKLIKPFAEKVWPKIKEYATFIFEMLETVFSFLGFIAKAVLKRLGIKIGDDKKIPDAPPKTKRLTEAERAAELEKIREEQRRIIAKEKADKAAAEAAAKAAKEGNKAVVMATAGGGGGGEVPQIPDEVDNWGITSKNYDMEMF